MILVDRRERLAGTLDRIKRLGGNAEELTLDSGDFVVGGDGPGGVWMSIGVELKHLSDILGCLRNGRLAGSQLPTMRNTYDRSYLLVEADYRRGERGAIEICRRGVWDTPTWARYMGFDSFQEALLTLTFHGGVVLKETSSEVETARWLINLDRWVASGWDSHKSAGTLDRSYYVKDKVTEWVEAKNESAPGRVTQVAKELPKLGDEKARIAALHFGTIRRTIAADPTLPPLTPEEKARMVKAWSGVDGVGKTIATKIVDSLDEPER
jgi:ERCC4-type nuclease